MFRDRKGVTKMEWIYPILGKQKCLPFYLSGVGVAEPEYHVRREEGLVSHQLLYTKSGKGHLLVGGGSYALEPGSLFYLGPGIPHEYYPVKDGEWTTCWVVFRGEYLAELLKGLGFEGFVYDKDIVNEKIEKIFHQILKAAKDPIHGDERCSMLLYEYIVNIRQALQENQKYGGHGAKDILRRVVVYINENYADDITLEKLAGMSGVTKQHFCRVFKEQMRMRPMEYLARRRMAVARNMLLTTEDSIAQIGEAVGYDNPTYFGMVFKKYEGITPTDCRKRHGTSLTW